MRWSALLLAAGCDRDCELPELPELPEAPGAEVSARVLSVGPVAPGLDVAVSVRPVRPGGRMYAAWSASGPGEGPCLPERPDACYGLRDPVLLGPVTADYSGRAALTAQIEAEGSVWIEALVVEEGELHATDLVERPVYDPEDVYVGDAGEAELPELADRLAITGELRLEGTDLGALSLPALRQVGGGVALWENPALDALDLPSLAWVGGDLSLYDDPSLADLSGLGALERVGGSLSVNRMPAIADLSGLGALAAVGGDVYLFHDGALRDTDALGALAAVGGSVIAWEDAALRSISLPRLARIGSKLDLFEDDALDTLSLPALVELGAYEMHHCDAMTGPGAFDALRTVDGEVAFRYNAALTNLDGLAGVERMDGLTVAFCRALPTLADLRGLTELTLGMDAQSSGLIGLDLPALQRIGALSVRGNESLVGLDLDALAEVGDAGFFDNPALPQCEIEALLDRVAISGAVACSGNAPDGCTRWCE